MRMVPWFLLGSLALGAALGGVYWALHSAGKAAVRHGWLDDDEEMIVDMEDVGYRYLGKEDIFGPKNVGRLDSDE